MTPSAVLFDAGNTLVFLDYARLASAIGDALGLPLTEAGLQQHAGAAARAMEQGRLTDRERGTVFLLTLFERAGVPAESHRGPEGGAAATCTSGCTCGVPRNRGPSRRWSASGQPASGWR